MWRGLAERRDLMQFSRVPRSGSTGVHQRYIRRDHHFYRQLYPKIIRDIQNKGSLTYILWVALAVGILIIIGTLIFAYKRGLFKFEKREKRETAPDNSAQYSMVPVSSPDRPETRIPDNPDDHIYAEAVKRPKPKEEALYFELEEPPQMKRDPKRPDVDAET